MLTAGMGRVELFDDLASDLRARYIKFVNVMFEAVIQRRNCVRVERIGLDDVGAGFEVLVLNGLHDARLRDIQHIIVLTQVLRVVGKLGTPKSGLVKLLRLNHSAHGAIQNDDPLLQKILQRRNSCCSSIQRKSPLLNQVTEPRKPPGSQACLKDGIADISLVVYRLERFPWSPILAPRP